ncbi:class I SAM-dependent methyltransferase [Streptomyces sp. NPDC051582]|uniref:class I SAM-dependent methyltransferase n=1 Tax=Streptomyces sp. NPDC051582 TaxID=3155167 RepID=UPI0034193ABC
MNETFTCPVCADDDWETHGCWKYQAGERTQTEGGVLSDYELLRRRVLFEVWYPGRTAVTLRERLCLRCGFMTYAPRPTSDDVAAKYRFLQHWEKDIGGSASSALGAKLDRRRADRAHVAVVSVLGREPRRVLDFGGGNGKLLAPFLERGADCALVDYNDRPLSGVRKLADTLRDLPDVEPFDAIVCSHVLEHLADPLTTLQRLRPLLSADGVLYSEVPVEIWKGLPIGPDPVTHINFFTPRSLTRLHTRAGLRIVTAHRFQGNYAAYRMQVAALVSRREDGRTLPEPGADAAEARRLLRPSMFDRLVHTWHRLRLPGT